MARRNTVWVLWEVEWKPNPKVKPIAPQLQYHVTSKRAWQKECDYNRRADESLAKRGMPPRGRVLRHIAESHDKQLLVTMLELVRERY